MEKPRNKKTIKELRQEIIEFVGQCSDKHLLKIISQVINTQEGDEEIHILSWEQLQKVEIAMKQIENGEVVSNEEVNREMKEWLKKK